MAKIKNVPAKYISRSGKLPPIPKKISGNAKERAERQQSYLEAPIDDYFYIDHRKRDR